MSSENFMREKWDCHVCGFESANFEAYIKHICRGYPSKEAAKLV